MFQLMIGFNRGVMVLWNVESSSAELTYVAATVSFTVVIYSQMCCMLLANKNIASD